MRADGAAVGDESIAGGGFRARSFAAWPRWCGNKESIAAVPPRPLQLATGFMTFQFFCICRCRVGYVSMYTQRKAKARTRERERGELLFTLLTKKKKKEREMSELGLSFLSTPTFLLPRPKERRKRGQRPILCSRAVLTSFFHQNMHARCSSTATAAAAAGSSSGHGCSSSSRSLLIAAAASASDRSSRGKFVAFPASLPSRSLLAGRSVPSSALSAPRSCLSLRQVAAMAEQQPSAAVPPAAAAETSPLPQASPPPSRPPFALPLDAEIDVARGSKTLLCTSVTAETLEKALEEVKVRTIRFDPFQLSIVVVGDAAATSTSSSSDLLSPFPLPPLVTPPEMKRGRKKLAYLKKKTKKRKTNFKKTQTGGRGRRRHLCRAPPRLPPRPRPGVPGRPPPSFAERRAGREQAPDHRDLPPQVGGREVRWGRGPEARRAQVGDAAREPLRRRRGPGLALLLRRLRENPRAADHLHHPVAS